MQFTLKMRDNCANNLLNGIPLIKNIYKNFIALTLSCLTLNTVAMIKHQKYSAHICPPQIRRQITLHYAAETGNLETIQNLLPHYDDIDTENNQGETPLFVAIRYSKKDAAAMFLKNGADPNTLNRCEETPLIHAIANKSLECTMLLLEKGAKLIIGKHRPENYLFEWHAETPPNKKIIENYKFTVPVHSKILCMRLELLYEQQQKKLYQSFIFLIKFLLQHYLHENNDALIKNIIHRLINANGNMK